MSDTSEFLHAIISLHAKRVSETTAECSHSLFVIVLDQMLKAFFNDSWPVCHLVQMLKIFELEPSFAGTGQWLEAQQLLARLDECTAELSSGKAPDAGDDDLLQDFVMGLTKLEEVGSPTMHGLLQSVGCVCITLGAAQRATLNGLSPVPHC